MKKNVKTQAGSHQGNRLRTSLATCELGSELGRGGALEAEDKQELESDQKTDFEAESEPKFACEYSELDAECLCGSGSIVR